MPLTVSHALSATTPDNPAYEIKPSNWNSGHIVTLNAVGSEISGAFSNAVGGVTFGLETNGYITGSAPAAAGGLTNINVSAGTTSNNLSAFVFSNANNVSFGLNGSTITANVTVPGATDTWAATGNNTIAGLNTTGTFANDTYIVSGSGGVFAGVTNNTLVISAPTTYAGSGFTSTTTAGTAIVATNDSAGLSMAVPAFLTTQSNQAFSAGGGSSAFQTLNFSNGNGVTFTNTNGQVGASVVTSYRASNDAIGTNTAQSNVTWTANSAGLSLDARGYAGTATTLALTNLSGTWGVNSNGIALSLNNPDDHVKGFQLVGNTAGTNASTYTTTQAQVFSGGANITLSGNSNTIVISGPAAGGTTFYTGSFFANQPLLQATTTMTFSGSTLHMASFSVQQNMSIDFLRVFVTGSVLAASSTAATTGNTSYGGGSTKSHNLILYTRGVGASSMSLQNYGSTQDTERAAWTISAAANSTQFSYSLRYTLNNNSGVVGFTKDYSSSAASLNFHSSHLTDLTGLKQYEIPFATALTPGQYWLGYQVLTSMSTARTADESRWGLAYSTYGVTAPQLSFGTLGGASNSHFGLMPMVGSITTNVTTTTASFPLTNITSSSNNAVMFFQGMRIT